MSSTNLKNKTKQNTHTPPTHTHKPKQINKTKETKKKKYIYIPRESKKIVQELQMSLTLIKSLNHRFVVVLMKKT